MKLPELHFPEGTHPQYWDFYDYVRIILNSGRYELRVVTAQPDWAANDGEMVLYDDTENDRKYLYMYIADGWYAVTFLTSVGGGTRFHNIGEIFIWGGSSTDTAAIPANCIVCNGAAVSRTTYSEVYAVIANNFGAGDGSTTFNVPDLRGRVPLGADNMGGSSANRATESEADSVGGASGNENGVASHRHVSVATGGSTAGQNAIASSEFGGAPISQEFGTTSEDAYTKYTGTGSGNMMPYQTVNYLLQA